MPLGTECLVDLRRKKKIVFLEASRGKFFSVLTKSNFANFAFCQLCVLRALRTFLSLKVHSSSIPLGTECFLFLEVS